MKRFFLLLFTFVAFVQISFAQVSLKGIELGKPGKLEKIETTVAGIEGRIGVVTTKDGIVCALMFTPFDNDNELTLKKVAEIEADRLIKGVEEKYQVSLRSTKHDDENTWSYEGELSEGKSEIGFEIVKNVGEVSDDFGDTIIILTICNKYYFDKYQKEEQENASSDF